VAPDSLYWLLQRHQLLTNVRERMDKLAARREVGSSPGGAERFVRDDAKDSPPGNGAA
jgi:hypothetical protein